MRGWNEMYFQLINQAQKTQNKDYNAARGDLCVDKGINISHPISGVPPLFFISFPVEQNLSIHPSLAQQTLPQAGR
jgi:hypothetical protein